MIRNDIQKAVRVLTHRFLLLLILALSTNLSAQPPLCNGDNPIPGELHVYADPQIMAIGEKVELLPDQETSFPGFRVQVYNGNDRNQAQKIKTDILQSNPDMPVYLVYEAPYFKVRVGDFRDRIEAQKTLHNMKLIYTGVLLVPDKINFPETH
jgi:hypothetical protein